MEMINMERVPKHRVTLILRHLDFAQEVYSLEYNPKTDFIVGKYRFNNKDISSEFPRLQERGWNYMEYEE